ncbi:MAG: hypothetical protein ACRERU_04415 [Methylococcales bacterium]
MHGASPHPVFDLQRGHTRELSHLVGDEDEACAARVRGDVQAVDADGLARVFERGADLPVVLRGLGGVGQDFEAADLAAASAAVFMAPASAPAYPSVFDSPHFDML